MFSITTYVCGSLVARPLPAFQCCTLKSESFSACNIEKLGVAWQRGYMCGCHVFIMHNYVPYVAHELGLGEDVNSKIIDKSLACEKQVAFNLINSPIL